MLRTLPPAGTHIPANYILDAIVSSLNNRHQGEQLNAQVRSYFGSRYCLLFSSGRAALTMLLKTMKELKPGKDTVILPAYTSFSVASAVVKAGLKISLCDVDPDTLSLNTASLKKSLTKSILGVVVCHLYGYPCDMDPILHILKENDIYIIDDAAQAMGSSYNNRFVGTFGDAGIFSLNRGKNITTAGGGIIITDSESIYERLSAGKGSKPGFLGNAAALFNILAIKMLIRPEFYWMATKIPMLDLGTSKFSIDYPLKSLPDLQAALGCRMMSELERINKARQERAGKMLSILNKNGNLEFITISKKANPVFLRLAVKCVIPPEASLSDLGIIKGYPCPLNEVEPLKRYLSSAVADFPGAAMLSRSLWTLPTHAYVTDEDIRSIASRLA